MMKRLLSGILAAAMLCVGAAYSVMAEESEETVYKPVISMSFDEIGEGQQSSYSENGVNVTFDNKASAWVSGEAAPEGKEEQAEGDRAIKIGVANAKDNPNVRFSMGSNFAGKMKLSFRFYVPSVQNASYGLLSVDFRNGSDGGSYSNMLTLRGNKTIQYFPTGVNITTNNGTYTVNQWYIAEFYIDADSLSYDVYLNGELKYENCPMRENTKFDQLRFAVNNSNQNVKDTYVYVDDIFLGIETDRPTPVFVKTLHASGVDNTQATQIPRDMTGVQAQFPYAMDPASFEGNVSLTRGSAQTPVAFSGEYDAQSRIYTVYLEESAMPCTEYHLTFDKDIKTSDENDTQHAGVSLSADEVIILSTEKVDFTVLDAYFSSDREGADRISQIGQVQTLYANVDYAATDLLQSDRKLSAFVVVYQNGLMTDILTDTAQVAAGITDIQEGKLQIPVLVNGMDIDENVAFELVVWDDFVNMLPAFKNVIISNQ